MPVTLSKNKRTYILPSCLSFLLNSIFILIFLTDAYAVVFEYSVNKGDGLIAIDFDRKGQNTTIKTFTKSPDAPRLRRLFFLNGLFVCGTKEFGVQKSVTTAESGANSIFLDCERKRWDIDPHDSYLSVKYFEKGEIKDRYRVSPRLPVHDITELFTLFIDKGFPPMYDFYLFQGEKPLKMRLLKEKTFDYSLMVNDRHVANILYGSSGFLERMVFHPSYDSSLKGCSIELKNVCQSLASIGKLEISIKPEYLKKTFESMDQWNKPQPRSFAKSGEEFRYLTRRVDIYDIQTELQALLKEKLFRAGVITSPKGFENLKITFDPHVREFSVEPNADFTLQFQNESAEIGKLKQRIRNTHRNVHFSPELQWEIENPHRLSAKIQFDHMLHQISETRYSLAGNFRDRYRETPDYYKHVTSGNAIRVTAFKKRSLWFDKELGAITFQIPAYWNHVSKELNERGKHLEKNVNCWFDSSGGEIVLRYEYSEPAHGSETLVFDLEAAFRRQYQINPTGFLLNRYFGGVTIRGVLSDQQRQSAGMNEIKYMVRKRFDRTYNCTEDDWRIDEKDLRYLVEVACELSFPVDTNTLRNLIGEDYNIMEGLDCSLISPGEIGCSFWGFKK